MTNSDYMIIEDWIGTPKKRVFINENANQTFETYSKYEYDRTPNEKIILNMTTYRNVVKELEQLNSELQFHPEGFKKTFTK